VLARPDGTILTAAHLVSRAKHIVVHCPGRKETVARTEALARSLDLAVIKTDLEAPPTSPLASSHATRIGEPLFTIGFPVSAALGSAPRLAGGMVRRALSRGSG
jgi:S1-C subfamily serine protease